MTASFEVICGLCDNEPNHHGFTLRQSFESFKKWFDAFEAGDEAYDVHLGLTRDLNIPKEEEIFILGYTGTHSS